MTSDNIYAGDVVVISGIRPKGRMYKKMTNARSNHGLLYIWSGEATFYMEDGITRKVTDGQLFYLPKGLKYKMEYTGESTTFVVVNFNLMDRDGAPVFLYENETLVADADPGHTFAGIMNKLEMCSAAQNPAGQLRRSELLYRLLAAIYTAQELSTSEKLYPQIGKGVMLLKQTYLENLPIVTFAKACSLCESAFRQLFRKQYGISPLQYRNHLRIQRAKELLEYDHCTVAEAAYASGFDNLGYFCRYYKKITGQTPKETKEDTT